MPDAYCAGLPLNVDEIGVASQAAFRLGAEPAVRSLAVMANTASTLPHPSSLAGGASITGLAASMFDGAVAASTNHQAPSLSRFYMLQKATSYRSTAGLSLIMLDLEAGFSNHSVQWQMGGAARYECDTFAYGARLEFSVTCFQDGAEIVVDVVPLSGCRAAFTSFYASFAQHLAYAPLQKNKAEKRRRFESPPLPPSTTLDAHVPAEARHGEAARLCDMYPVVAEVQRAVASKAAAPESAELFFGADDAPTPLAGAVAHAAANDEDAVVAFATIANLAAAARTDAAFDFLAAQLPACKEQLEDSECAHTRRECLRALAAMATACEVMRAKIVRAGLVDLLELEALAGAEEGRATEDHRARAFASTALVACRA